MYNFFEKKTDGRAGKLKINGNIPRSCRKSWVSAVRLPILPITHPTATHTNTQTHTHTHTHTRTHTHTHMHARHMHTSPRLPASPRAQVHAQAYALTHALVHTRAHMCAHTRTHTYTVTQSHAEMPLFGKMPIAQGNCRKMLTA